MTECSLGRGIFPPVRHPGPVIGFEWRGAIGPAWMMDLARESAAHAEGLERAIMADFVREAVPIHATYPELD